MIHKLILATFVINKAWHLSYQANQLWADWDDFVRPTYKLAVT